MYEGNVVEIKPLKDTDVARVGNILNAIESKTHGFWEMKPSKPIRAGVIVYKHAELAKRGELNLHLYGSNEKKTIR